MPPSPIADSLDRTAQRLGDPSAQVYARLFAQSPALEPLFVLDRQGAVRQEMLRLVIDAVLDLAEGEGSTARGLIATEAVNHANLGIDGAQFSTLFSVLRDVVRDTVADDWTPETEAAWQQALDRVHVLAGA